MFKQLAFAAAIGTLGACSSSAESLSFNPHSPAVVVDVDAEVSHYEPAYLTTVEEPAVVLEQCSTTGDECVKVTLTDRQLSEFGILAVGDVITVDQSEDD